MSNTNLIPSSYRTFLAKELVASIDEEANSAYYIFLGNHVPDTNTVVTPIDTIFEINDAYRNMISAKRVSSQDASLLIRYIPYTANTVYAKYDDQNELETKDYYAVVNAGAYSHVWKVLDNDNGNPSTVAPDFSQIDIADTSYRTSDGYLWKYMYSVDDSTISKFGTANFFPLKANTDVEQSAVSGALNVFNIDVAGSGYRNWLLGTFTGSDVRVGGNTLLYALGANSSSVNGFYTGCNLYISSGTGAGQYKMVKDYFSNANGNFVVLDSAFSVQPQNLSGYQIYPGVTIKGTGQSVNAEARALVNAVSNSIYRIDVLAPGQGYNFATANVIANSILQVSPASIRPIFSPYDGHGSDAASELKATHVSFSVLFANTEQNTIPATNTFKQIGVIADPVFSNVIVNFTGATSTSFALNEEVKQFTYRLVDTEVNLTATSTEVTGSNDSHFDTTFVADDWLFFKSNTDSSITYLAQVNVVANSSSMTIKTPSPLTSSVEVFLANITPFESTVLRIAEANSVVLGDLKGIIGTGTTLVGLQSGAFGTVDTILRNGVYKGFGTFNAMKKMIVGSVSGTFQENEMIYQGTSLAEATSSALVHSTSLNTNTGLLTIYSTNVVGNFRDSNVINGANSDAVGTLSNIYDPEITFDSGKILYLENITPVTRNEKETEQINLIVSF